MFANVWFNIRYVLDKKTLMFQTLNSQNINVKITVKELEFKLFFDPSLGHTKPMFAQIIKHFIISDHSIYTKKQMK